MLSSASPGTITLTGSASSYRLEDMHGGWFIGAFSPTALACSEAEVALKRIAAGTQEKAHVHLQATEVNLVVSGELELLGRVWGAGDIIVIPPGCPAGSRALSDCMLVVVKTPSVPGDKYEADAELRRVFTSSSQLYRGASTADSSDQLNL